jgi:hypothetical protein
MSEPPAEQQPQTSGAQGISLQEILDARQRSVAETAACSERPGRHHALSQRLEVAVRELVSFAGGLLSPTECPRNDSFFADLARALLAFNAALNEADSEYPRYRIRERLSRAARAGVPALDTAASLLLLPPTTEPAELSGELQALQGDRPRDQWLLWLTYICDQLLNSNNPPVKDNVLPNTGRDEWRKAELAFGCVLFSDESFRVIQDAVDQAGSLIDAAMKAGSHPTIKRPPGRVRDLLACYDPRALEWYGKEQRTPPLLEPPPSVQAITEPAALRRQLDEVWTAANCLQIALDKWQEWFRELAQRGDALPAAALNCAEMADRAISVLCVHRPNVAPFDREDGGNLRAMLPPLPAWRMAGTGVEPGPGGVGLIERARVGWQEDREFLDRYYCKPEGRLGKAAQLRGAATRLIELLKSYPLTAVCEQRLARTADDSNDTGLRPDELLRSRLNQVQEGRRREAELRNQLEQRRRPYRELRPRWDRAWEAFYAWPAVQNQQGRKPCPEGFIEWANVGVELGSAFNALDRLLQGGARAKLRKAVCSGVPELECAAAFVLLCAEGGGGRIAEQLEALSADPQLRQVVGWLPYVRDALWRPDAGEDGLIRVAEPPDGVSFEDFQRAEQAFGAKTLSLDGADDANASEPPEGAPPPVPPVAEQLAALDAGGRAAAEVTDLTKADRSQRGPVIVPLEIPPPLTLQTLRDELTEAGLHPSQRQTLQEHSPDFYRRLTRAAYAVAAAADAGDPLLLGARHHIRERFGAFDPAALGRVVDWLVAEHDLSADQAAAIPLGDLLRRLRGEGDEPAARAVSGRKARMTAAEANERAMGLAKADRFFVKRSLREWAEAIGCSEGLVAKLPLWLATMEKTGRGKKDRVAPPKAVSLTGNLEAVLGDEDAELKRLMAEQQADMEPNPCEDDPPDTRPRKVRTHKRV